MGASRDIQLRRVWVDDPNAIFRRGLVSCLDAGGFEVAGESAGLRPPPEFAHVDILLFDVDDGGLQRVSRGLSDNRERVRLVGMSRHAREETLYDAVESGLSGFLLRSELSPESLCNCLRTVAGGGGAIPPKLLSRLFEGMAKGGERGAAAGQLAGRELKVLSLLAGGGSTREIATELCYSERTVKNIVHDVLVKMNCKTRTHAVAVATRQGYI